MNTHVHMDDGAHEVVSVRPARKAPRVTQVAEVSAARSAGPMAEMRLAGDRARREFLLMRRGDESVKLALVHLEVFRAIVRIYLQKRTRSDSDFGASIADIVEMLGTERDAIRTHVASLLANNMIRSRVSSVGFQGRRAVYYPTALGEALIGIAEVLGHGAMVKTGLPANAWTARNQSEPPSLFQCAALLSGPQEIK